ncbi:UNVERIFIED_CONTAM: hypothetical protein K2H54_023180 [Gekko kuhli]
MEHSGHKAGGVQKDTALWGGAPQYDYVHFEHCTTYGIPSEAGHETGGTGDNTRYQEKAFNHAQATKKVRVCDPEGLEFPAYHKSHPTEPKQIRSAISSDAPTS